ncbi:MAG: DUF3365 domain-containing protein [Candidatus Sericytochromatia bacterium]|nr:DUF3365 domain-containing protein [Candidatus Sericytochromatia bacterium]
MPTLWRLSMLLAFSLSIGGCEPAPEDTGSSTPAASASAGEASTTQALSPEQAAELLNRSQAATKMLKSELKAALTQSLQSQGTVAALSVCKNMAPAIAQKASAEHQLAIRRISLKNRNPAAKPDNYEAEVLEKWLAEQTKDPSAARPQSVQTVVTEVITTDGQQIGEQTVFRYMEPLYIDKGCLQCHGSQLQPKVQQSLNQLYPEDQATGYEEGDLRGAVSVSIVLPTAAAGNKS